MYKLFGTPINQLTVTQTIFLYKRIFSYNRIVDENGLQTGIVTPKSLCSTVLLSPDDGDIYFNDWFVKFTRNNCVIQEGAPLLYTRDTATKYKGEDVFSYSLVLNKKNKNNTITYGIYHKAGDYTSWTCLILEWLGETDGL